MPASLHRRAPSLRALLGYLAASCTAALLGGYFTAAVTISTFYATLTKPAWAPPGWIFAPVWTFLYISMSLAMWLVWRKRHEQPAAFPAAHAC